ncbi:MAG: dUTP diphosphatase [Actinobacteria bacterium]|nr:MAG: dUTP diphosphatase [Actinomycetota bacterium]
MLKIKQFDKDLPLPGYAHTGDAGMDLFATDSITLKPGQRALVGTGIAIAIEDGYAGFVQPRSGLAIKHGISLVNTPGLVDSKYRGEIKVIIINTDLKEPFTINRGDKIAQLVIQKVETVIIEPVEELDETVRGVNGFGSTGINLASAIK